MVTVGEKEFGSEVNSELVGIEVESVGANGASGDGTNEGSSVTDPSSIIGLVKSGRLLGVGDGIFPSFIMFSPAGLF